MKLPEDNRDITPYRPADPPMTLTQHDIDTFVEGAKKRNADGLHSEGDLIVIAMTNRAAKLTEALIAERAYHRNNTGENARRRKETMAALPKKWDKEE